MTSPKAMCDNDTEPLYLKAFAGPQTRQFLAECTTSSSKASKKQAEV
jgi:hypothetical protein